MESPASVLPSVWFAGTRVIVRVRGSQSGGRLAAWESQEPRNTALPLHVHTREDEQVVLLEGTLSFAVGDLLYHLAAGDTLALPRGLPHAHIVTSHHARVLTIAMPSGFEQLFVDLGVPALPATRPAAFDRSALEQAVAQLGVKIVGPPLTPDSLR